MNKSPLDYSWLTYLWIGVLSVLGGTAQTIRRIRSKKLKHFSISEWIGDVIVAGFLGVITFYLCEYSGIEQPLTAALVGIASHQGTKGLMALEQLLNRIIFKGKIDG